MKLYIINVGVNSEDAQKRGIKSPVFEDSTFEFVPIMESKGRSNFLNTRYKNIPCYNKKEITLKRYIPEYYWNDIAHNDPEFVTFTYGDNWKKPKGANFLKVEKGDMLLFLSRLYDYNSSNFTGNGSQYFIGYIIVDDIIIFDCSKEIDDGRLNNNSHYMRYKNGMNENFIIFIGNKKKSFRFKKALKIDPGICEIIFNGQYIPEHDLFICNETGDVLKNRNGKPKSMKNFHCITRAVQYYLDDENKSQKTALQKLMKIFKKHIE